MMIIDKCKKSAIMDEWHAETAAEDVDVESAWDDVTMQRLDDVLGGRVELVSQEESKRRVEDALVKVKAIRAAGMLAV